MEAKLIITDENQATEYELPVGDSIMLGIELETIFHQHGLIDDDDRVEIIDKIEAKRLHY